jgi:hypothetical protein
MLCLLLEFGFRKYLGVGVGPLLEVGRGREVGGRLEGLGRGRGSGRLLSWS